MYGHWPGISRPGRADRIGGRGERAGPEPVRIFCIGEVKAPGAIEFSADDRITLLSVLAKAGGLTDRASKKIRIKRRDASGRDVEYVSDYKRVLAGKDPDPILKADDVVVVKESFF